jgi:hypothetical protein
MKPPVKTQRRPVELNEPARESMTELRQHLVSASNELYLHELLSSRTGRPVPEALRRAHASIRAELRRLEQDEA